MVVIQGKFKRFLVVIQGNTRVFLVVIQGNGVARGTLSDTSNPSDLS